jgi:hypothetical protein
MIRSIKSLARSPQARKRIVPAAASLVESSHLLSLNTWLHVVCSSISRRRLRTATRLSRCSLLVECRASASRGDSTDKRQRGAAVYRWNAALNQWTECHAVLLTSLWPTKPRFHATLPSQVAILSSKPPPDQVVKGQRQRSSPQMNSTKFPLIKGSKNVGFHPLRAIFRGDECKFR